MQDSQAKMDVLNHIIELMTGHQLGGLKKKGAPAAMAIEVSKDPAEMAEDAGKGADEDEDESPDLLQKLVEMYGKKDDEEDDDKISLDSLKK